MNDTIHQLWQLIYSSYEQNSYHGVEVGLAMGQDKNEMQHRLLQAVSTLKIATPTERSVLCDQIRADILLSQAQNWMSLDAADKAQELLDTIKDTRD